MLARSQPPAQVCAGLVAEALRRGSTDNVSVLLVRLGAKPITLPSRPGQGPRTVALAEQRKNDAKLSEEELVAKANELKRQGKYVPRHLQVYLRS